MSYLFSESIAVVLIVSMVSARQFADWYRDFCVLRHCVTRKQSRMRTWTIKPMFFYQAWNSHRQRNNGLSQIVGRHQQLLLGDWLRKRPHLRWGEEAARGARADSDGSEETLWGIREAGRRKEATRGINYQIAETINKKHFRAKDNCCGLGVLWFDSL